MWQCRREACASSAQNGATLKGHFLKLWLTSLLRFLLVLITPRKFGATAKRSLWISEAETAPAMSAGILEFSHYLPVSEDFVISRRLASQWALLGSLEAPGCFQRPVLDWAFGKFPLVDKGWINSQELLWLREKSTGWSKCMPRKERLQRTLCFGNHIFFY